MKLVGVVPASLLARPVDAARRAAAYGGRRALADLPLAELLEVRLDLRPAPGLPRLGSLELPSGVPVVATVRSRAQGGGFAGPPEEAAEALCAAARDGAAWVDVEADVASEVVDAARATGARVLASQHGVGPIALPSQGVAAWKIARPVDGPASLRAALAEARALAASSVLGAHPPAFVVPYGALGAAARVVTAAVAEGAGLDPFVYGRLGTGDLEGGEVLPGVPSLADLVDEGRLGEVSGGARLFGLLGRPPSRSPSPAIHNACFRALGIDAVYLPAADLDPDLALDLPYDGFSVTTPWKEEVARRCDVLDPLARRVGAVNTVVRAPDGRLHGWNTDAIAVREALREAGREAATAGGSALVLGGGGFARAAAAALLDAGLRVRLVGASARTRRAAADLGVEACGDDRRARDGDAVAVNATPVGAYGEDVSAWAAWLATLAPRTFFLDGPYASGGAPGALAVAARARGLRVEDGGSLLVRQAAGQALRFLGRGVDPRVLRGALGSGANLVLVGPRGAGKTHVGRSLARRLGRPFVDTDDALARVAGRAAGRVLAETGEAAFRALEAREVDRALARRGAVVALGGGALASEARVAAVRAHAFVVRLTVAPEEAARRLAADPAPRPRLTDAVDLAAECARLAAAREPRYAAAATKAVATDGLDVEAVVEALLPWAEQAMRSGERLA